MAVPESSTLLPHQTPCPDPAAHEQHDKAKRLQDQAADAALYVTHPERATNVRDIGPLGPDGKLSSAGAATSLRYARPQDLPSYPSVGIETKNSGLTAATLAHANTKNIEWWTPSMSQNASKAALLAHSHKTASASQPEGTPAGSKAAAMAHNGQSKEYWKPGGMNTNSLKAATLAVSNRHSTQLPPVDYGYTDEGRKRALMAAKLSVSGRKRAESSPVPSTLSTPQTERSDPVSNALRAATAAHADARELRANEASRITHARNLSREMYTEHPPVAIERQEKDHQDALKASAISMAKKMYAVQHVDNNGHLALNAGQAARKANRSSVDVQQDVRLQAIQYLNLQDAAQRLAAERLQKIEDQHEAAAFKDYYGYGAPKRRNLLTLKGRNRQRASSDTTKPPTERAPSRGTEGRGRNWDVDSDDEEQAAKVRSQMSQFNARLAEVDNHKRDRDRQSLFAAAERKVAAQMSKMDEKVFNETGKMSPAMMEDWDNRARAKAVAASQLRMQHHGKIDVGGGKFIDQSEIDAIAAANIKPTLDQIHETAEKQRARDEEIRLERAEAKRQGQLEKERLADSKVLQKKAKAEEKEAEKLQKREEKENAKLNKQNAKEAAIPASPEKQKGRRWTKLIPVPIPIGGSKNEKREPGVIGTPSRSQSMAEPDTDVADRVEPTQIGETAAHEEPEADAESLEEDTTVHGALVADSTPITPVVTQSTAPVVSQGTPRSAEGAFESERGRKREKMPSFTSEGKQNRMSRLFSKFSISAKKDKKDDAERSFTGGARLTKEKHTEGQTEESAAAATTEEAPVRTPVSSLSESIAEDADHHHTEEVPSPMERIHTSSTIDHTDPKVGEPQHGGSTTSLTHFKTAGTHDLSEDDDQDFEEARDQFESADLVPPPTLLSRKTESPARETKFKEAL